MVELGCTDSEGSVVQVPSDGFFFFFHRLHTPEQVPRTAVEKQRPDAILF